MANWIPDFFKFGRSNANKSFGYNFGWSLWGGTASFPTYTKEIEKLETVLSSPAALKVIALICDLYSLGRIYVYEDGKEVEGAPELELFDQPNPMQSQKQWKWTYMFWNLMGTVNLYMDKDSYDASNKLYFLVPHKTEWPRWFEENKDKLIFSSSKLKDMQDQQLVYRYEDGTDIKIPFKKVIQYFDMSNGLGNWFTGNSRLDALCKIIDISEEALKSKKINIKFSGQFLVGGASKQGDVNGRMLSPEEKVSIEERAMDDQPVRAIKNMIELHRFVSDMGALKLDEAYIACALQIADMWNVPKEIISLLQAGSTYENQEQAKGSIVTYCLEPKGEDMCGPITKRAIIKKRRKYVVSWDHLPFMQYAEQQRADVQLKRSITIRNLQQSGVTTDEINSYLDTSFTDLSTSSNGTGQENAGDQGTEQGPAA